METSVFRQMVKQTNSTITIWYTHFAMGVSFPSGRRLQRSRLPNMPHHGGAIVAKIWLPVVNRPSHNARHLSQNPHIPVIVVPTKNARCHWSTQANIYDILCHLSFRERTKKSLGRHLTATQGTTQSHNTRMPETVVRVRTTRWGQSVTQVRARTRMKMAPTTRFTDYRPKYRWIRSCQHMFVSLISFNLILVSRVHACYL